MPAYPGTTCFIVCSVDCLCERQCRVFIGGSAEGYWQFPITWTCCHCCAIKKGNATIDAHGSFRDKPGPDMDQDTIAGSWSQNGEAFFSCLSYTLYARSQ
jgi:hypothetical protein